MAADVCGAGEIVFNDWLISVPVIVKVSIRFVVEWNVVDRKVYVISARKIFMIKINISYLCAVLKFFIILDL